MVPHPYVRISHGILRTAFPDPRRDDAEGNRRYLFDNEKEPPGLAGGSSYAPVRLCYQQRPNRRIANLASAFLLLAARKRATRVGKAKLRTLFILFQLFLYVIPNLLFVLAYRIHVSPGTRIHDCDI